MGREYFASYRGYLLENVVFTTLAVPVFANARLINGQIEFVGVNSFFLRPTFTDQFLLANMFIPKEALQLILSETLAGC